MVTINGTLPQVTPSAPVTSVADLGQQCHSESNSRRPSFHQATISSTSLCLATAGQPDTHPPHQIEDADFPAGYLGVRQADTGNSPLTPSTPGLQVPSGGEDMNSPKPTTSVAAVPPHTGSGLIVQGLSSAMSSPSLELNHPDIMVQQFEASPAHSSPSTEHSSSQAKSVSSDESAEHGGLIGENSEGLMASELAALSPPATRSRTMASTTVEGHDKAAGPSSSKKNARKAKNRRLKSSQQ